MNDADDEAFGAWAKKVPFQERTPKLAWKAALEWRDSQVGELVAEITPQGKLKLLNVDVLDAGVKLYAGPPPMQINHRLIQAFQEAVFCGLPLHVEQQIEEALKAATQMRGDT